MLEQNNHDNSVNPTNNLIEENQGVNIYNRNNNNSNSSQSETQIFFNEINSINNNPSNVNLKIIKEIDDKNLLQNVQNICIYAINNYKFNNHEDLRNIIQENLHKNLNGNWWVSVCDKLSSDYGNIDYCLGNWSTGGFRD